MAAPRSAARRRPRRGSVERPVNARLYRGTWLLVALPLLVAAFSVSHPAALSAPLLPPAFDEVATLGLAQDFSKSFPDRSPGSSGATGATQWVTDQLTPYGLTPEREPFSATIPGRGRVRLVNLVAVVPGPSQATIVVMAHRDDAGTGPGANDNASGTAALIELARTYAAPASTTSGVRRVATAHRIVFLSSDGGAFGGLGARWFAEHSPYRDQVVAVVNLDSIAGPGRPRLELAGDEPRSPAAALVQTAAARIADQTGDRPARPGALAQLIDLGFPFSLYEQAPFVGRGIPAVTITTAGSRPPNSFTDQTPSLRAGKLAALGRAAQELVGSLDQGLELTGGTSSYVYLGTRVVRGWAIELVLIAMLVPFLVAIVDLYARTRRLRIPLAPALRSFRSRLAFWAFAGLVFALFAWLGIWIGGAAAPIAPESRAAGDWPLLGLVALGVVAGLGWLVARDRLLPRRPLEPEEELAGHTGALLSLGMVALLVVATNPFALLFVLPSLHAWLWLPQVRGRSAATKVGVLALGALGPLLLIGSMATRFGLGFDAPWYLAELTAVGYVPLPLVVVLVGWLAAAAQLAALTAGRYAPYPPPAERPALGPLRRVVRALVLAVRNRRRVSAEQRRALGG